jgi:hypothetical protein
MAFIGRNLFPRSHASVSRISARGRKPPKCRIHSALIGADRARWPSDTNGLVAYVWLGTDRFDRCRGRFGPVLAGTPTRGRHPQPVAGARTPVIRRSDQRELGVLARLITEFQVRKRTCGTRAGLKPPPVTATPSLDVIRLAVGLSRSTLFQFVTESRVFSSVPCQ